MTTEPTQPFQPVAPEPTPQPLEAPPTEPVAAARPKPRSATPGWINVALGLAVAVAIGGVAFAAGRITAPATVAGANNGFGRNVPGGFQGGGYFRGGELGVPGDGQGGRGLFGAGGATIQGTVTSISADKVTITTAGGQTVDIALDGSTTYHLESSASSGDVKTGGTVIVRLTLRQAGGTQTGPSASDITIVP
jgi:hypothetical protein